jgi:hypothetical protein
MMANQSSHVYTQYCVDKRKVKPATVVGKDGPHVSEGINKVIPSYFFADQLHQSVDITVDQIKTNNCYLTVKPGQAGGLDIKVSIKHSHDTLFFVSVSHIIVTPVLSQIRLAFLIQELISEGVEIGDAGIGEGVSFQ